MIDSMPIFLPKKPSNRAERRIMLHEVNRVLKPIDELEVNFLDMLFCEDEKSYHELYTTYLEHYIKLINIMALQKKFQYTVPNLRWFEQKYAPLELTT